MTANITLGAWLKERRRQLDLTQTELAEQASCSVDTVRKIEQGVRRPSKQLAALLAEALNIPQDQQQTFITLVRAELGTAKQKAAFDVLISLQGSRPHTLSPSLQCSQIKHNLPAQATAFIGREREIRKITGYLNDPTKRLITILGPGGMGKTRLALAVGEWVVNNSNGTQHRPTDGVFFVPLASVDASANIVQTIATAMTLSLDNGSDRHQQLISYLERKHLLLLMDNCEHLLDGIELFVEIIQAAPNVQIVATSRERLLLQGEQLFSLSGLDVLSDELLNGDWDAEANTAVHLFQQAVQRIQPNFLIDKDTLPFVIQICQLVEGMPLGIELAASWLDVMPVSKIVAEIQHSLDFLESDTRNIAERHRSMRAVFAGSWQQMNTVEQEIFTKLAVFRGGFTRNAARTVANATKRQLRHLQFKSLLQFDLQKDRFHIHELLRQFGVEKLAADKEKETAVCSEHAAYYCIFLHERESAMKGAGFIRAHQDISTDIDNVRRAWDWTVAQEDFAQLQQAAESLAWFYHWPSRYEEGLVTFTLASDKMEAVLPDSIGSVGHKQRIWVKLLSWQAGFSFAMGHRKKALLLCQKAMDILTELEQTDLDIRSEKAQVLYVLAEGHLFIDLDTVDHFGERSLALYREIDDQWGIALSLVNLGRKVQHNANDNLQAESYFREAWQFIEILGHPWEKVWGLINWGLILASLGRFKEGTSRLRQAQALSQETRFNLGHFSSSLSLADITLDRGHFKQGQMLLDKAIMLHDEFEEIAPWYESHIDAKQAIAFTHLGKYEQAGAKAMRSVNSFGKLHIRGNRAMSNALLASIKLVQGKYEEAQTLLDQTVQECRESNVTPPIFLAKLLQAYSLLKQNKATASTQLLVDALEFALPRENYIYVLMAIPAAAFANAINGNIEKAITLYSLAQSHDYVGNSRWFADLFGQPIAKSAATLPEDQVKKAEENGRSLDLWQTAESLLHELRKNREGRNDWGR